MVSKDLLISALSANQASSFTANSMFIKGIDAKLTDTGEEKDAQGMFC